MSTTACLAIGVLRDEQFRTLSLNTWKAAQTTTTSRPSDTGR